MLCYLTTNRKTRDVNSIKAKGHIIYNTQQYTYEYIQKCKQFLPL